MTAKIKQKILEITQEIESLATSGILIIVEGKNDKKALLKLGLENIVSLSTPLYKIVEIVNSNDEMEVVILTDFDRKGKELYLKIKSMCSQRGIRIDTTLRGLLRRTDLIHIEGLFTFLRRRSTAYNQ